MFDQNITVALAGIQTTLLQLQGANKHASASVSALIDNNGEPTQLLLYQGA